MPHMAHIAGDTQAYVLGLKTESFFVYHSSPMSALTVVRRPGWIFYTIGDLFIVPHSVCSYYINDAILIKSQSQFDEFCPTGVHPVVHISEIFRTVRGQGIISSCQGGASLYCIARDLPCDTYRYDDLPDTVHLDALKSVWKSVCDDILSQLF